MKSKFILVFLSLLCISTLVGCNLNKLGALLPESESAEIVIENPSEEQEPSVSETVSETEEPMSDEDASAESDDEAKTLLDTAVNNLTSYSYDCEIKIVMDMGSELLGDMGSDLSGLFGDVSTSIEIIQRTKNTVDAVNGTYVGQGTTTTTAFGTVTEQETIVYTVTDEDGYTSYTAVPFTDNWLKDDVQNNSELSNYYENVTDLKIIEETDTTYVISGTLSYENVSGNINALTTESNVEDGTQVNALYTIDKETQQLSSIEITYGATNDEAEAVGFEMTISLQVTSTEYAEVIIPEEVINAATESTER